MLLIKNNPAPKKVSEIVIDDKNWKLTFGDDTEVSPGEKEAVHLLPCRQPTPLSPFTKKYPGAFRFWGKLHILGSF